MIYISAFVDRCLTFCPKVYFDKKLRIEQGEILQRYFGMSTQIGQITL